MPAAAKTKRAATDEGAAAKKKGRVGGVVVPAAGEPSVVAAAVAAVAAGAPKVPTVPPALVAAVSTSASDKGKKKKRGADDIEPADVLPPATAPAGVVLATLPAATPIVDPPAVDGPHIPAEQSIPAGDFDSTQVSGAVKRGMANLQAKIVGIVKTVLAHRAKQPGSPPPVTPETLQSTIKSVVDEFAAHMQKALDARLGLGENGLDFMSIPNIRGPTGPGWFIGITDKRIRPLRFVIPNHDFDNKRQRKTFSEWKKAISIIEEFAGMKVPPEPTTEELERVFETGYDKLTATLDSKSNRVKQRSVTTVYRLWKQHQRNEKKRAAAVVNGVTAGPIEVVDVVEPAEPPTVPGTVVPPVIPTAPTTGQSVPSQPVIAKE